MSIFVKIFLTISIFTSIFLGLFDTYIIDIERKNALERLNNKIVYNELIYKNTISQLLFDYNKNILFSNLDSLYLDPEIVQIELIDYSTVLDYKLNQKKHDNTNLIKNSFSLNKDNQVIGILHILYTKQLIEKHIHEYQNNLIKSSVLLVLILFCIIFYIIYNFTKSIKKLTNATKQITSGNLNHRIAIKSNDEIGILANEFETMRKSLNSRIELTKQQLQFQQLLMDTVSLPIYIKDINLKYIGINKAFSDFFGLKKEDILNKTISEFRKNDYTDDYDVNDIKILNNGKSDTFHTKIYNSKGELRDVILYKNTFVNAQHKTDGLVGTVIDITELNNATKKLNEINITLEQKVKDRTIDLESSNKELADTIDNLIQTQKMLVEVEKMASLGGLVAGVAHELNTPVGNSLMGITHFSHITDKLEKSYKNEEMSQESFEDYLITSKDLAKQIHINLEKAALLVKNFKQVAVDQSSEEKRVFNLKQYLEEIVYSLSYIIKQTEVKIVVKCEDNIELYTYAGAYSQIFTNLLINSFRHAYGKKARGQIHISVEILENQKLKLHYRDDGKGIKAENLPHIFDPFFTTNREEGGTGLGLNIIYNIITSNFEGSIECKSIEKKGVDFFIILPLELPPT